MVRWLDAVARCAEADYGLACEIARAAQLVKGYVRRTPALGGRFRRASRLSLAVAAHDPGAARALAIRDPDVDRQRPRGGSGRPGGSLPRAGRGSARGGPPRRGSVGERLNDRADPLKLARVRFTKLNALPSGSSRASTDRTVRDGGPSGE